MFNQTFFEGFDLHQILHQQDVNTDKTSLWVPAFNYDRVYIAMVKGGTEDVDDIGLEVRQAKDKTGDAPKALGVTRVWTKSGAINTVGQWTFTQLSTPATGLAIGDSVPSGFTRVVADVDTGAIVLVAEVMSESLDVDNGFTHVAGFVAGANINNACLVSMFALFQGARYSNQIPLNVLV